MYAIGRENSTNFATSIRSLMPTEINTANIWHQSEKMSHIKCLKNGAPN